MRAAQQQRDQSNVTIQGMTTLPINVTTSDQDTSNGGALGISVWQLLINSDFYANYATMYDEIRMNGFRMKIIGNSAGTTILASGLSSVGTVVALDRNGVRGRPLQVVRGTLGDVIPDPYIQLEASGRNTPWQQALSYGSAKIKSWSPGNAFQQWISAYASNMMEKAQYVKTQSLRPTTSTIENGEGGTRRTYAQGFPSGFRLGVTEGDADETYTPSTETDDVAFDPVILLGVYNVPQTTVATTQTFTFSIEYKVDVTFRGVRRSTFTRQIMDNIQGEQVEKTLNMLVTSNGIQNIDIRGYTDLALTTNVDTDEMIYANVEPLNSGGGSLGTITFDQFSNTQGDVELQPGWSLIVVRGRNGDTGWSCYYNDKSTAASISETSTTLTYVTFQGEAATFRVNVTRGGTVTELIRVTTVDAADTNGLTIFPSEFSTYVDTKIARFDNDNNPFNTTE